MLSYYYEVITTLLLAASSKLLSDSFTLTEFFSTSRLYAAINSGGQSAIIFGIISATS